MTDIERALSALNQINPSCVRSEWLRAGMAAKSAGLSFIHFHEWSKRGSNYTSEKECKIAWDSFKEDGGITPGTLFYMAYEHGWKGQADIDLQHNKFIANTKNHDKGLSVIEIWEQRCLPATPAHEYIIRKQGRPDGLRYYPDEALPFFINNINVCGYLAVPCFQDGILQTLQFIPPNEGQKLNLPGNSFAEGYFAVGEKTNVIYICEGLGQAWAVYAATGCMSVVCFGSGRMRKVTKVLRDEFANSELVIIPDRGKEDEARKIANEFSAKWVELPQDKPQNYDVNDYAKEYGHDELFQLLNEPKQEPIRYQLLTTDDLMNLPQMKWLVESVFPAEGLGAVYGPSMSGKSFLALQLAYAISSGDHTWFGYRIYHAPVTYVCLEGEAGLSKRIKALQLNEVLPIDNDLRFVTQSFDLLKNDDIDELAKAIITQGGNNGMVVIDTMNRATPGIDENSSRDMGLAIFALKLLQEKVGGLVVLVHHTGKSEERGPRGHSSLFAALDVGIETKRAENPREWSLKKSKEGESGKMHAFNLEVVKIGIVDDRTLTSCVVTQLNHEGLMSKRPKQPTSGNQKIVWDVLGSLFSRSSHYGKGSAPSMKACLQYDYAIENVMRSLPCDKKRQNERAKAAINQLVSKGLLKYEDGWLWFP